MCFGDPSKSIQLARERMTAEQWARFEREFDDFCVVQGLKYNGLVLDWAKWAFFCARPRPEPLELTDWRPCTTPPVRDGWYDVWRGAQLMYTGMVILGEPERVRFANGRWDHEASASKAGVFTGWDCWRGVKGEAE